eukprot:TRINITY_DN257_c0_g1_i12.p1 TRINITY_DN257_c0_g1~~TRINITY_DN257_c0_g1_i12.p1  ORF type:complete len:2630 (-),score=544.13 TRINITY_DN257_c0_g1_i12:2129-10018(-)
MRIGRSPRDFDGLPSSNPLAVRSGPQSDAFSLPQSRHGLPPLMRPPPGGLPPSMPPALSPESRASIQLTGSPARRVVPLAVNPDRSHKGKRGKDKKGKESAALPAVPTPASGRGIASAADLDSEEESVIIGPEPGPLVQDTIKAPVTMAEVNRRRRRILRRINWTLLILSFIISITVLVMVIRFLPLLFGGKFVGDFGVTGNLKVGGKITTQSLEVINEEESQAILFQSKAGSSEVQISASSGRAAIEYQLSGDSVQTYFDENNRFVLTRGSRNILELSFPTLLQPGSLSTKLSSCRICKRQSDDVQTSVGGGYDVQDGGEDILSCDETCETRENSDEHIVGESYDNGVFSYSGHKMTLFDDELVLDAKEHTITSGETLSFVMGTGFEISFEDSSMKFGTSDGILIDGRMGVITLNPQLSGSMTVDIRESKITTYNTDRLLAVTPRIVLQSVSDSQTLYIQPRGIWFAGEDMDLFEVGNQATELLLRRPTSHGAAGASTYIYGQSSTTHDGGDVYLDAGGSPTSNGTLHFGYLASKIVMSTWEKWVHMLGSLHVDRDIWVDYNVSAMNITSRDTIECERIGYFKGVLVVDGHATFHSTMDVYDTIKVGPGQDHSIRIDPNTESIYLKGNVTCGSYYGVEPTKTVVNKFEIRLENEDSRQVIRPFDMQLWDFRDTNRTYMDRMKLEMYNVKESMELTRAHLQFDDGGVLDSFLDAEMMRFVDPVDNTTMTRNYLKMMDNVDQSWLTKLKLRINDPADALELTKYSVDIRDDTDVATMTKTSLVFRDAEYMSYQTKDSLLMTDGTYSYNLTRREFIFYDGSHQQQKSNSSTINLINTVDETSTTLHSDSTTITDFTDTSYSDMKVHRIYDNVDVGYLTKHQLSILDSSDETKATKYMVSIADSADRLNATKVRLMVYDDQYSSSLTKTDMNITDGVRQFTFNRKELLIDDGHWSSMWLNSSLGVMKNPHSDFFQFSARNLLFVHDDETNSMDSEVLHIRDLTDHTHLTKQHMSVYDAGFSSTVTKFMLTIRDSNDVSDLSRYNLTIRDSLDTSELSKTRLRIWDSVDGFSTTKELLTFSDETYSSQLTKKYLLFDDGSQDTYFVNATHQVTTDDSDRVTSVTASQTRIEDGIDRTAMTAHTFRMSDSTDFFDFTKLILKIYDSVDELSASKTRLRVFDSTDSSDLTKYSLVITDSIDSYQADKTSIKIWDSDESSRMTKTTLEILTDANTVMNVTSAEMHMSSPLDWKKSELSRSRLHLYDDSGDLYEDATLLRITSAPNNTLFNANYGYMTDGTYELSWTSSYIFMTDGTDLVRSHHNDLTITDRSDTFHATKLKLLFTDNVNTSSLTKYELSLMDPTYNTTLTKNTLKMWSTADDMTTIDRLHIKTEDASGNYIQSTATDLTISTPSETYSANANAETFESGNDKHTISAKISYIRDLTDRCLMEKNSLAFENAVDYSMLSKYNLTIYDSGDWTTATKLKVQVSDGTDSGQITKTKVSETDGTDTSHMTKTEVSIFDSTDHFTGTKMGYEIADSSNSLIATKTDLEFTDGTYVSTMTRQDLVFFDGVNKQSELNATYFRLTDQATMQETILQSHWIMLIDGVDQSTRTAEYSEIQDGTDSSKITKTQLEITDSTDHLTGTKTQVQLTDGSDSTTLTKTQIVISDGTDSGTFNKDLIRFEDTSGIVWSQLQESDIHFSDDISTNDISATTYVCSDGGFNKLTMNATNVYLMDNAHFANFQRHVLQFFHGTEHAFMDASSMIIEDGPDSSLLTDTLLRISDSTNTLQASKLEIKIEDASDSSTMSSTELEITDGTDTLVGTKTKLEITESTYVNRLLKDRVYLEIPASTTLMTANSVVFDETATSLTSTLDFEQLSISKTGYTSVLKADEWSITGGSDVGKMTKDDISFTSGTDSTDLDATSLVVTSATNSLSVLADSMTFTQGSLVLTTNPTKFDVTDGTDTAHLKPTEMKLYAGSVSGKVEKTGVTIDDTTSVATLTSSTLGISKKSTTYELSATHTQLKYVYDVYEGAMRSQDISFDDQTDNALLDATTLTMSSSSGGAMYATLDKTALTVTDGSTKTLSVDEDMFKAVSGTTESSLSASTLSLKDATTTSSTFTKGQWKVTESGAAISATVVPTSISVGDVDESCTMTKGSVVVDGTGGYVATVDASFVKVDDGTFVSTWAPVTSTMTDASASNTMTLHSTYVKVEDSLVTPSVAKMTKTGLVVTKSGNELSCESDELLLSSSGNTLEASLKRSQLALSDSGTSESLTMTKTTIDLVDATYSVAATTSEIEVKKVDNSQVFTIQPNSLQIVVGTNEGSLSSTALVIEEGTDEARLTRSSLTITDGSGTFSASPTNLQIQQSSNVLTVTPTNVQFTDGTNSAVVNKDYFLASDTSANSGKLSPTYLKVISSGTGEIHEVTASGSTVSYGADSTATTTTSVVVSDASLSSTLTKSSLVVDSGTATTTVSAGLVTSRKLVSEASQNLYVSAAAGTNMYITADSGQSITVGSAITVTSSTSVAFSYATSFGAAVTMSSTLTVSGTTTLGALSVGGTASFSSGLTVSAGQLRAQSSFRVDGDFSSYGNRYFYNNLNAGYDSVYVLSTGGWKSFDCVWVYVAGTQRCLIAAHY